MSVAIKRSEVLVGSILRVTTIDGRVWQGTFSALAAADRLNISGKNGHDKPGSILSAERLHDVCETIKAMCASPGPSPGANATPVISAVNRMGCLEVSFVAQTKNARGIVVAEETIVAALDETVADDEAAKPAGKGEVCEIRRELRECVQLCARMSKDLRYIGDCGSQLLSERSPFERSAYKAWRAGNPVVIPILFSRLNASVLECFALFPQKKIDDGVRKWRISRVGHDAMRFSRVIVNVFKAEANDSKWSLHRFAGIANNAPDVWYACGRTTVINDGDGRAIPNIIALNPTTSAQYTEQPNLITAGPASWSEFAHTEDWANKLMAYLEVFRRDMRAVLAASRKHVEREDIAWE